MDKNLLAMLVGALFFLIGVFSAVGLLAISTPGYFWAAPVMFGGVGLALLVLGFYEKF